MAESFAPDTFAIEPSPSGRLLCGGCAGDDVCRLGVGIADVHDDVVRAEVSCARSWQGGPGVAHGGWIAAVFDDVLTAAALRRESRLVTKSLAVSYLRPVARRTATDSRSSDRWPCRPRVAGLRLDGTSQRAGTGHCPCRTAHSPPGPLRPARELACPTTPYPQ
ncbi:PaaI family thioesterase [Sciscionella sediminilitoris]|uniref:PaaI family thioesterase n=1 Tax=Sciscionella sediminilitoris TaxID=1445613 RepID=UPI001E3D27F2|nr:PaaI family thioesterase [Sciscionella sp. SE31]